MGKREKKPLKKSWNDGDRLRWALEFAQANLSEWRDGDWLNALEDLIDFLFAGSELPSIAPDLYHALDKKNRFDRAKAWLPSLQRALKKFIERLYGGEAATVSFRGSRHFIPHPEGLSKGKELQSVDVPTAQDLKEGLASEVLLRVGDLLTRMDLSRLKQCPECQRLFLAVRRQRFDTPQCSLKDRLRRFRTRRGTAGVPRRRRRSVKHGRRTGR